MRIIATMLAGLGIAIVLFFLMSSLIAGGGNASRESNTALNLDFIRLNLDEMEITRRRVPPPEPPEPKELEVPLRLPAQARKSEDRSIPRVEAVAFSTDGLDFNIGNGLGRFTGNLGFGAFSENGDLYPILRVSPAYPSSARLRRIVGWVDLEYTVLPDGSVIDPVAIDSNAWRSVSGGNAVRVDRDIFVPSALEVIVRWRFKPRVVDGRPVPVRVTQRINFDVLDDR